MRGRGRWVVGALLGGVLSLLLHARLGNSTEADVFEARARVTLADLGRDVGVGDIELYFSGNLGAVHVVGDADVPVVKLLARAYVTKQAVRVRVEILNRPALERLQR